MNLGPAEILVILVVALLVLGPQRLPDVARQLGRALKEVRQVQDALKRELDDALRPGPTVPPPAAAPIVDVVAGEAVPGETAAVDQHTRDAAGFGAPTLPETARPSRATAGDEPGAVPNHGGPDAAPAPREHGPDGANAG